MNTPTGSQLPNRRRKHCELRGSISKRSLSPWLVPQLVPRLPIVSPEAIVEGAWDGKGDLRVGRFLITKAQQQTFMIALGIVIFAISAPLIFVYPKDVKPPVVLIPDNVSASTGTNDEAEEELAAHAQKMVAKFVNFMALDSVQEKSSKVRHRERVRPLMERYYQTHPISVVWPPGVIQSWKVTQTNRILDGVMFYELKIDASSMGRFLIIFEQTEDGNFLIDWECLAGYGQMTLAEFEKSRPELPTLLRVRVERANYFNFGFTKASHRSFLLSNLERSTSIHAFSPRHHPIFWQIQRYPALIIVEAHFESIEGQEPQAVLGRIIRRNWILP